MAKRDDLVSPPGLPAPAATAPSWRLAGGGVKADEASVAAEVPVALVYNGISHAVMLATPADIEDFALGFSLSEDILKAPRELLDLDIVAGAAGIEARMTIAERRFAGLKERRRNLAGRTGCGLCGVDSLGQVVRQVPPLAAGPRIAAAAIERALAALPPWQAVWRQTGAVHAAAWADLDGGILLVREDVGRHNALDKLIGGMVGQGLPPDRGFALITSRCSFEMVQKAATVGIAVLVAISAPTTLALRVAEDCGLTLVAMARPDSVTLYANPGRILDPWGTSRP